MYHELWATANLFSDIKLLITAEVQKKGLCHVLEVLGNIIYIYMCVCVSNI